LPTQPTYPGVYIEEIPSGVRTISGVATSIAAFIGYFRRGPMNKAVQIFNMGDFERELGGLDSLSEASYAIQQFFLNGGTQAYVVRVAAGSPVASNVTISSDVPAGAAVMRIRAKYEGKWGDNVRVKIDHSAPAEGEFNLSVAEYNSLGNILRQETFLNVSMDNSMTNFVSTVINDENTGSAIIKIDETDTDNAPAANGTLSGEHGDPAAVTLTGANPAVDLTINGTTATATFSSSETYPASFSLNKLALLFENAIRSAAPTNKLFSGAKVEVQGKRLHITAGTGAPKSIVSIAKHGGDTTADELLLTAGASNNLQEYVLGDAGIANTAQMNNQDGANEEGNDGTVPGGTALLGTLNDKTGLYALEDVDLFNILCIPRTGMMISDESEKTAADSVMQVAIAYCESKRAFFIMDTPWGIDDLQEIKNWIGGKGTLRSKNAALYYPRVRIPDPLNNFRLRSVGACGTMAGLYARTDSNRGVWKAPAGTEANLRNVSSFTDVLSDQENGILNQLGVNCLRTFPVHGNISWGARTLDGADAMASEWKYIPVRRLALFLEESLFRGSKWVVFEPNDEPLWAQIRLNIGAFMNTLFRQGAFQGTTPREAYFVKCDRETTTQNDINSGIVNILVGFAPLKPAEFVMIRIQQLAGQIET
jgi:phage tail sheath protein FI